MRVTEPSAGPALGTLCRGEGTGPPGRRPRLRKVAAQRTREPADTYDRIRGLLGPAGITRVADVTGLDRIGIPVTMVVRPNARGISVSQGKGLDLLSATVSGVMESLETYAAERIDAPLFLGRFEEVSPRRRVVDVERLARPARSSFHPASPLLWIAGEDLLNQRESLVPYEMVHTDYTYPLPSGTGCFAASSSGLASGNHRLEAISHALCELIERDAHALWRTLDADAMQDELVDLDTVDDPSCRQVLDAFARSDIDVAVWDQTTDVGVAAFGCAIADRADNPFRRIPAAGGSGCHPDRGIALLRALTEAAQSRLTMISGSRDDLDRRAYDRARNPRTRDHLRSAFDTAGARRGFGAVPTLESDAIDVDVEFLLERLRRIGIVEVVVVDLGDPVPGVEVVRVVVPGLDADDDLGQFPPTRPRPLRGGRSEAGAR